MWKYRMYWETAKGKFEVAGNKRSCCRLFNILVIFEGEVTSAKVYYYPTGKVYREY